MQAWLESLPLGAAILFFWAVGIVRTTVIFALGRAAAGGGRRIGRVRRAMETPVYRRAEQFVNRWGVLAVPACFLTVGLQTAVILTTAVTGMPLRRWIPAMLAGTFIWGIVYGTVGMAVVWAWLERPWAAAAILLVVVVGVRVLRARRRARQPERRSGDPQRRAS